MASANSEGLSTISNSSVNNSVYSDVEVNVSRSPSISSIKDYIWPNLLVSKHKRSVKKIKGWYKCSPV